MTAESHLASSWHEACRSWGWPAFDASSTVTELRSSQAAVPHSAGIYIVLRPTQAPPQFVAVSSGGHFKGRNPTVDPVELRKKWLDDSPILYIGKADDLHRRLREYMQFGTGVPRGHWGGRYIWQLADAERLVVAWAVTPSEHPRAVEARLLAEFRSRFGALPFANLHH